MLKASSGGGTCCDVVLVALFSLGITTHVGRGIAGSFGVLMMEFQT